MPTKLEANASFKKPRLVFLVLALALIFSVVFVGGVSGYEFPVSTEEGLRSAIYEANRNGVADTIILMDDITLVYDRNTQVGLPTPIQINSDITIKKVAGKDITIKSSYTPVLSSGDYEPNDYDTIDSYTLFVINGGATLTLAESLDGTFLKITTNLNGRAFDVKSNGNLVMNAGVKVVNCGFDGDVANMNNGGAVYIRNNAKFTMNGGLLSGNKAGAGGAICAGDNDGYGDFVMNGGQIEDNTATRKTQSMIWYKIHGYGGGVWLKKGSSMTWTGGDISGNNSPEPDNDSDQDIYSEDGKLPNSPNTEKLVLRIVNGKATEYKFVSEAYDAIVSEGLDEDTIYIKGDLPQIPGTIWIEGVSHSILDTVVINGKDITIKPYSKTNSITLDLTNQMFTVTSGSLTISGNDNADFTVINTRLSNSEESDNGGFVLVNGGTLNIADGVSISGIKAVNGGAVYLEKGEFTLSGSASITGCTASGKGGAVYVADGTFTVKDSALITGCTSSGNGGAVYVADGMFTVKDSASVDASNDVYLEDGEVITAEIGYKGTIGKITLPEYNHGTRVVYIGNDNSGYPDKFSMNQEGMTNGFERLLEIGDDSSKEYLVLVNTDVLIVIPSELIIIKEDDENKDKGSMIIEARVLNIPKKASVFITVDSLYDFTLAYLDDRTDVVNPDISLEYILSLNGNSISDNEKVTAFTMSNPERRTLFAEVQESPLYAGEYVDTLTFIVRYDSGNYN